MAKLPIENYLTVINYASDGQFFHPEDEIMSKTFGVLPFYTFFSLVNILS